MKKGLYLFYNHTSLVSGAEISLLEVLSELKEKEILLACPGGKLAELATKRGIKWTKAPSLDVGLKKNPYHILLFILSFANVSLWMFFFSLKHKPSAIYANSVRAGIGCLAARLLGIPLIIHVRDILPEGFLSSIIIYLLKKGATYMVFNSHLTMEKFGERESGNKIIVYSPAGYRFFKYIDSREAKRILGLEGRYPVITLVGQIAPWKRYELAIGAVKSLKEKFPQLSLLIVGDVIFRGMRRRMKNEIYYEKLKMMVKEERVDLHVIFTGQREDVEIIMNASDLLLLTSKDEPFGRVAAEGMACGIPVLVSERSGIGRIIREKGLNLLYPEPADEKNLAKKIEEILENPDLREICIKEMMLAWELFLPFIASNKIERLLHESGK